MEDQKCEQDLFCGVNKPKDLENLTCLEKKHIPVIDAPEAVKKGEPFEVTIEVGKLLKHPNELGHFIQFIDLYSGDTFITRVELVPELSSPKVTLKVTLNHEHPLRAFEHCNLHGTWEGRKEIKVE